MGLPLTAEPLEHDVNLFLIIAAILLLAAGMLAVSDGD